MYVMEEKFCFKMKGGFVPFTICPLCLMSIYTEKSKLPGNPGEGSDNYAKWHGFNVWEDDIKY